LHMVDQGTELICRELLQDKRTNSRPSYRVALFTPNDGGGGSGCSRVMVPKGLVGTAHERGYLTESCHPREAGDRWQLHPIGNEGELSSPRKLRQVVHLYLGLLGFALTLLALLLLIT
jgi:hypothetical protein